MMWKARLIDKTLNYDWRARLRESQLSVFSCGAVYYAVQSGSNVNVLCVIQTLVRDHSNESY